jgi:hypothetical protein
MGIIRYKHNLRALLLPPGPNQTRPRANSFFSKLKYRPVQPLSVISPTLPRSSRPVMWQVGRSPWCRREPKRKDRGVVFYASQYHPTSTQPRPGAPFPPIQRKQTRRPSFTTVTNAARSRLVPTRRRPTNRSSLRSLARVAERGEESVFQTKFCNCRHSRRKPIPQR